MYGGVSPSTLTLVTATDPHTLRVLEWDVLTAQIASCAATAWGADALRALNCEYAQGFHYAAPVPAGEADDMLRAGFDV